MADQPFLALHLRSDEQLEEALRAMLGEIAWPAAVPADGGPDIAMLVTARLAGGAQSTGAEEAEAPSGPSRRVSSSPRRSWWPRWTWRPATRALVVALVVLLALAALVGAAGLGLPGLRIIFGGPEVSPTPAALPSGSASAGAVGSPGLSGTPSVAPSASPTLVPGPPGTGLGLGRQVDPSAVDGLAGFAVPRPSDPSVGPPDAAWLDAAQNDQVALVWSASDRLPETTVPGVGLIEMAFRGRMDEGWVKKIVVAGTKVEAVEVNGHHGYWISGDPHFFFYEGPDGIVEESRRWVGDALVWSDGPITYRLETSLGLDAAIALADSLR